MEHPREPPWSEQEKVYLLAELLKAAPLSSDFLMRIVRDWRIEPKWQDMCLPFGRSLSSCQAALSSLHNESRSHPSPVTYSPHSSQHSQARVSTSELPRKRPLAPETSALNTMGRIIQPRPPSAYPGEPMRSDSPYGTSPRSNVVGLGPGVGVEPAQKKKRGRPTKAEAQARAEAAARRGETYPTPRQPRPSNPHMVSPGGPLQPSPTSLSASTRLQPAGQPNVSGPATTTTSESELEASPKKQGTTPARPDAAMRSSIGGASDAALLRLSTDQASGKPAGDPSDVGGQPRGTSQGPQQLSPPLSSGPPSNTQLGPPQAAMALSAEETEAQRRFREGQEAARPQQSPQEESASGQRAPQTQGQQQRSTPRSFKETVGM